MTINSLKKRRLELLDLVKDVVSKYGWNELLIHNFVKEKKVDFEEIKLLFPEGNKNMIQLSIEQLNIQLKKNIRNFDLINLPLHKRIKKILLQKIFLIDKEKNFYKKTFYYLLIPGNYFMMTKLLYKSVDQIWIMANDNSTDFNFYTKRMILSGIYSSLLMHYFNNNNVNIEKKIDNELLKVSKIPIYKNKFKKSVKNIPLIFSFFKNVIIKQ